MVGGEGGGWRGDGGGGMGSEYCDGSFLVKILNCQMKYRINPNDYFGILLCAEKKPIY